MAAGCLPCVYHVGTFPGVFTGISPDLVTTRDALGEGAQTSLTRPPSRVCMHYMDLVRYQWTSLYTQYVANVSGL